MRQPTEFDWYHSFLPSHHGNHIVLLVELGDEIVQNSFCIVLIGAEITGS